MKITVESFDHGAVLRLHCDESAEYVLLMACVSPSNRLRCKGDVDFLLTLPVSN